MTRSPIYLQDVAAVASLKLPWQGLKGKKVLITGASGFLGSFLVDVLMARNTERGDGISVAALARSKERLKSRFAEYLGNEAFRIIARDISAPFGEPLDFNYIVHAASNTHPNLYAADPVGTITANAFGTHNLLSGCTRALEKFGLLSTVEIYGENMRDAASFGEDYCGYINCNTLRAGYPESKRLAEALCQAFIKEKGYNVSIARLARVYGPSRADDSKAAAQFLRNAVRGEDIVLKSKGDQVFSYIYYADAVSALLHVLFFGENGEAYNAANDDAGISLFDLASLAAKIAGTRVIRAQADETEKAGASPVTRAVMSVEKLKALGWRQQTSMEEGTRKTINILREFSRQ